MSSCTCVCVCVSHTSVFYHSSSSRSLINIILKIAELMKIIGIFCLFGKTLQLGPSRFCCINHLTIVIYLPVKISEVESFPIILCCPSCPPMNPVKSVKTVLNHTGVPSTYEAICTISGRRLTNLGFLGI